MPLLPGWPERLGGLAPAQDQDRRSALLPRKPAFYLEQVNVVTTAGEAEAMAEFAEQRPLGWVGFDTEFRYDRPPLLIDGETRVYDPRSVHPLLMSMAMADPARSGGIRIYRFVIDLRPVEVLPGLERVLGLPCCFVAHH